MILSSDWSLTDISHPFLLLSPRYQPSKVGLNPSIHFTLLLELYIHANTHTYTDTHTMQSTEP